MQISQLKFYLTLALHECVEELNYAVLTGSMTKQIVCVDFFFKKIDLD